MTRDGPPLDVNRIIDVLARHQVEYVLVGGVSTRLHGALRLTDDLDCMPERTHENLTRLAGAMTELNARLRVGGLTDVEARQLPVQLDAATLERVQLSTWRTDAGDFDVLADMPDATGARLRYDDLVPRAATITLKGVAIRVAALDDVIASKEWADRPKDRDALPELRQLREAQRAVQANPRPAPPAAERPPAAPRSVIDPDDER